MLTALKKLGLELAYIVGKFEEYAQQYEISAGPPETGSRKTEIFATHYEKMLRLEFGLNLKSCYSIERYLGTVEYFNENTKILREDNIIPTASG